MISYFTILSTVILLSNADNFNPELNWSCTDNNVLLTLKTINPFDGIIVSSNASPNCRFYGNSSTITTFIISEKNDCGLIKQNDSFLITLEVHQHRLLILSNDRIFKITCKTNNNIIVGENDAPKLDEIDIEDTNSTDIGFVIGLKNPIEDKFTTELIFSETYDLIINMKTTENINGYFKIFNCSVYSDKIFVHLINNRGCSIDNSLINEFKYYSNYAIANIPSMFKFRKDPKMNIKCKVITCDYYCKPFCERQMDSPIPEIEDYNKIARIMGVNEITTPDELSENEPITSQDAVLNVKVSERQIRSCSEQIESQYIQRPVYDHPVIFILTAVIVFQFLVIFLCCVCSKYYERKTKIKEPTITDNWAVDEPQDYTITPINTNTLIIGNSDTYNRRNYCMSSFKRHNQISKDFNDYYSNSCTTENRKSNETLQLSTFNPQLDDNECDNSRRSIL